MHGIHVSSSFYAHAIPPVDTPLLGARASQRASERAAGGWVMETNTARATHRGVVRRTRNVDDNVPAAGMLAEKFRDVVHDALDYEPAVGIGVVLRHLGERERLRAHPPSTCPLVLALHPPRPFAVPTPPLVSRTADHARDLSFSFALDGTR